MTRLPTPGQDKGLWGTVLNDFLLQAHNSDGTLKPIAQSSVTSLTADLSARPIESTVDTKISVATSALAPLASPTFTGTVGGITKTMVGLSNADNTSDSAKPISTATQTALDGKVSGTGFSAIVKMTQAAYDALSTKDANTFYVIVG
jgi:hypothetical protein